MNEFFLWLGFVGSWFLFAGPIYQAVLELQDEDIEIDRIRATGSKIQMAPKVSSWWWLLPPVKFYKEFQRGKQSRLRIFALLSPADVAAMVSFNSKATAWLFVAFGGLCIASKETYELAHDNEWSSFIVCLLILGMFVLSILNLIYRLKRTESIKGGIR